MLREEMKIKLKHIQPDTLFTISLVDMESYIMRCNNSILELQTFREWDSIDALCREKGYSLETVIDAWEENISTPQKP